MARQKAVEMSAYLFIAPNFVGFAVFTMIPIVVAVGMSFCKWDGSNPAEFIGLDNFISLFRDTFFVNSLFNTFLYCIGTVPLTLIVALTLAVLLNQKIRGRSVFRVVSCIPYVSSIIAVTTVWRMIFHPAKGPVNALLYYAFQVPKGDLPQWFTGHLIIMSYILFSLWKSMGYYMVRGRQSGRSEQLAEVSIYYVAPAASDYIFCYYHHDNCLLQNLRYSGTACRRRKYVYLLHGACVLHLSGGIYQMEYGLCKRRGDHSVPDCPSCDPVPV